jgi:RNA polymerase primary sigma factor
MARRSLENISFNLDRGPGYQTVLPDNDTVFAIFKESLETPLLNKKQEIALSKTVRLGLLAQDRLDGQVDLSDEDKEALIQLVNEGKEAEDAFVKANIRLVISLAKRYQDKGLTLLELIQEGNIGLITAVRRFDHNRGSRFSTYATWWIKQGLIRSIGNDGRFVRLPIHVGEFVRKVYKYSTEFSEKNGRTPTFGELSTHFNVPVQKIENIISVAQTSVSLDAKARDTETDMDIIEIFEDEEAEKPEEVAVRNDLATRLSEIISLLPQRDQEVVIQRFGLDGEGGKTLDEIGLNLGISKERVRQLERRALSFLREQSVKQEITLSE